jgi:hypothetical protein
VGDFVGARVGISEGTDVGCWLGAAKEGENGACRAATIVRLRSRSTAFQLQQEAPVLGRHCPRHYNRRLLLQICLE